MSEQNARENVRNIYDYHTLDLSQVSYGSLFESLQNVDRDLSLSGPVVCSCFILFLDFLDHVLVVTENFGNLENFFVTRPARHNK